MTPLGAQPQTPIIGSRSRARHITLDPQFFNSGDAAGQNGSFYLVGNGAAVITGNTVITRQFHACLKDRVRILRPVNYVAALTPPVNVGVFNSCSIGNKSASIKHLIAESNLRLAAVVETWHDSLDCPDLIACAPPSYHYIERA